MEEYFAAREGRREGTPQALLPGTEKWLLADGLSCAIFEARRDEGADKALHEQGDGTSEEGGEDEDEDEEYISAFSGESQERAVFTVPP